MKEIDGQRLNALMEKCLEDMAAASSGVLVVIGDRLGLFAAIAQKGAVSAAELAQITGTAERMVREWLAAMAASGYVAYDVQEATYSMTSEQIALLADPTSPFLLTGVYRCIAGLYKDEPIVYSAFRHGSGVGWHEHHEDLFVGTEEFFGRVYENFLVPAWLPSLEDVTEKLIRGGSNQAFKMLFLSHVRCMPSQRETTIWPCSSTAFMKWATRRQSRPTSAAFCPATAR